MVLWNFDYHGKLWYYGKNYDTIVNYSFYSIFLLGTAQWPKVPNIGQNLKPTSNVDVSV